jgi:hypothetical protein
MMEEKDVEHRLRAEGVDLPETVTSKDLGLGEQHEGEEMSENLRGNLPIDPAEYPIIVGTPTVGKTKLVSSLAKSGFTPIDTSWWLHSPENEALVAKNKPWLHSKDKVADLYQVVKNQTLTLAGLLLGHFDDGVLITNIGEALDKFPGYSSFFCYRNYHDISYYYSKEEGSKIQSDLLAKWEAYWKNNYVPKADAWVRLAREQWITDFFDLETGSNKDAERVKDIVMRKADELIS